MRLGRAHMTPRRGGGGDPEPEEKEEDEAGQMSRKRPVPGNMWPPPLAGKTSGQRGGRNRTGADFVWNNIQGMDTSWDCRECNENWEQGNTIFAI